MKKRPIFFTFLLSLYLFFTAGCASVPAVNSHTEQPGQAKTGAAQKTNVTQGDVVEASELIQEIKNKETMTVVGYVLSGISIIIGGGCIWFVYTLMRCL